MKSTRKINSKFDKENGEACRAEEFAFEKIFALIYIYLQTHKNKDSLIDLKTNFGFGEDLNTSKPPLMIASW